MKYWMIIGIFLLGSVMTIIGGLIGVDNPSAAAWLLNISLVLHIIAVVLLVLKLVKSRKTDALNK